MLTKKQINRKNRLIQFLREKVKIYFFLSFKNQNLNENLEEHDWFGMGEKGFQEFCDACQHTVQVPFFSLFSIKIIKKLIIVFKMKIPRETTDFELECELRARPHLTDLNLSGCVNLTDNGLKFISVWCLCLEEIALCGCSVSDDGVRFLLTLPNLRYMDLRNMPGLSMGFLRSIRRVDFLHEFSFSPVPHSGFQLEYFNKGK